MRRVGAWGCVVVQLAIARSAVASGEDDDEPWKDGCPAFFPPETAPTYTNLKTHEGSAAFGTLPAIDSPLGATRVAGGSWLSYAAADTKPTGDVRPDTAIGWQSLVQVNLKSGPMVAVTYGGGAAFGGGTGAQYGSGNIAAFVGYRHTDYLLGPTFRSGTAVRLGGGNSPFDGNGTSLIERREAIGEISPFHTPMFGFDGPVTATVEQRIEMVGCHAPFLDLRVDFSTWQAPVDGSATHAVDVPIALAGGGYLLPTISVFGEIGVEMRTPSTVFLYRRITRTSFGIEYEPFDHHVHIGLRGGAIAGPNVAGFDLELAISYHPRWWKDSVE